MPGKRWTKEEELYLEDRWGTTSISTIAKHLRRSENAVIIRAQRMGLGAFLESGDYVTWNQLSIALGYGTADSYKLKSWVQNRGFPVRTKRVKNNTFRVVYLDEFWEWAEKNRNFLNFSKFEPFALGAEPEWVAEKRKQDVLKEKQYRKTPWTKAEDQRLEILVRRQQYTYKEIAGMLQRTEGAVLRRIIDIGIKDRPLKADNHIKWTESEFRMLGEMLINGMSYENMSEILGKSVKAIRGRVYQMYLTENLDKARELIGEGPWGNGRPERKIKHYLLMNQEERQQVRELMIRLTAIIRHQYKLCFDESDFWQKEICQHWDGYCTAGETDCDSCVSFQRIQIQYCKRCGKDFLERKEQLYCRSCRNDRKKQYLRKQMTLSRGK